ncbi:MAG: M23 family metallopeptidase [Bdellovibrionales bacterium]|nr:M23 family metallopeptidase [Bdellovibrionales bacterium]
MNKLAILFVILIGLVAGAFLFPERLGTEGLADLKPPTATIKRNKDALFITVSDELSGPSKITLQVSQNGNVIQTQDLLTEYRNNNTEYFNIQIQSFQGKAKEGPVDFTISAVDNSLWANTNSASTNITLDFTRPQLALHSIQHRMYAGGAELILFDAKDNVELQSVYLDVDEDLRFFPIRLAEADKRFASRPDLHAILFATPRGFPKEKFAPKITATDTSGNSISLPIRITFVEQPLIKSNPNISEDFVNTKIPPLLDEMKNLGLTDPSAEYFREEQFKLVNETYRNDLGFKLRELFRKQGVRPIIPEGPFTRPMAGTLTSKFGEARSYSYKGSEISHSTHDGQDIASVKGDKVMATAAGQVILAQQSFGIYGGAVVIDHGFGIGSLYGHLSNIVVEEGQQLTKGEILGNSGETGLAGGDHLHFEIRIQNVPVTPIEWWDNKWYQDNILLKLNDPELLPQSEEVAQ